MSGTGPRHSLEALPRLVMRGDEGRNRHFFFIDTCGPILVGRGHLDEGAED